MKQKLHIVYLPGLGDGYDPARAFFLKMWKFYGVEVVMIPMSWRSEEGYAEKCGRVEKCLAQLDGTPTILMGESAGGSMALTMYAKHVDTLEGVMTICGKNTRSDNVSPYLYRKNPAFRESMLSVEKAVVKLNSSQRNRFVSVVPWLDPTVPVTQTLIEGCQKMQLPAVGHLLSILAMLTIYAPLIVRRAKSI